MHAAPTSKGRTRPVRLTEVPLTIRQQAAYWLIMHARMDGDLALAADLTTAAERPSRRVYWVSETAVQKVLSG